MIGNALDALKLLVRRLQNTRQAAEAFQQLMSQLVGILNRNAKKQQQLDHFMRRKIMEPLFEETQLDATAMPIVRIFALTMFFPLTLTTGYSYQSV